jgi:hypothetical protein
MLSEAAPDYGTKIIFSFSIMPPLNGAGGKFKRHKAKG